MGARAAGVSAEDLVAAARVHLDRVHDAVRRLGCGPQEALEVVETSAVDLVEIVAAQPEAVEDAVGWWFARARELGRRVAARTPDLPLGGGVLAVDDDQVVLAEALDQLPERERVALLLRDSYDLPDTTVGAALGTDAVGAMALVGRARLAFLPLVDDEPAPAVAAHQDDLGALARLGESGPVAARDATVRRHALSCDSCRAVTDAQQRAHLLLTGLTVVALPDADRAGVLARVELAAYASLPSSAALLLRGQEQQELELELDDRRLFSPLLALLCLVLAALLGLGVGLLLSRDDGATELTGGPGGLPGGVRLLSPSPVPTAVASSPRTVAPPPPETTVFDVPPPSPSPVPSPSPQPPGLSPAPAEPLGISLDQTSGPNGTVLVVTGTGWSPDAEIALDYLDPVGQPTGSQTTAIVDADGRFTAQLTAQDPGNLPGRHSVRASDGVATAETGFDAQA